MQDGELILLADQDRGRWDVVALNRAMAVAVAVAEAGDPMAALAIVDRLDLDRYAYLHSTRADLLRRLGRDVEAAGAFARAVSLVRDEPSRQLLRRRLADLAG